jgi:ABC-type antimicrobial peptide transport system permease subunit
MGQWWPQFAVEPRTAWTGMAITLGIGLVAGVMPALLAARLRPSDALRSEG